VQAQWHRLAFETMGTPAYLEFWAEQPALAESLLNAVPAEFERINQLMSTYISSSEVSQLNQRAATEPVKVSAELYQLMQQAAQISRLSAGAFDITFASVGFYYDYRQRQKPDAAEVLKAQPLINYQHIAFLADNQIRFSQPGVRVDLGGIAKGYAVEQAAQLLVAAGIEHALVTAGGDTRLVGDKRGRPWLVAVKHPRQSDKQAAQLPLQNTAISTSGDYERYFIEDGVRYHHILDPKTGHSASGLLSVSVIGPDTSTTDALSTTLFVLGLEAGLALIEQLDGYEAIIISDEQRLYVSSGLAP
jgi:thiamine biosynthesis lipoprotein